MPELRDPEREKRQFIYDNNKITIEFGDLFKQPGIKVIPVSRYMHETDVYEYSLQDTLIKKYQNSRGGSEGLTVYSAQVAAALANKDHVVVQRDIQHGGEKQYPTGTLGLIEHGDQKYLLLALTETEREEHIVPSDNCDLTRLWIALERLWAAAPLITRGKNISIPLLGTGVTAIRLSPVQLLLFNILAILDAAKRHGRLTTGEIKIVLYRPKFFDVIDLRDIKDSWINSR